MADTTKVKRSMTQEKTQTETEKVVKDTAEGLGIGAVLTFLWGLIEPRAIEVGLHLKDRVAKEFNINRGNVGRSIAMMQSAKRTILLDRLQKAIDEKTNTHFMSLLSKFTPDEKGSYTDLFEGLADMNDVEFNAMLVSQDDKVAQWVHLIRTDGRQMLKDDLGFIADGARAIKKRLGALAEEADASAGQLAPRVQAFAEKLREKRLQKSDKTTRFTNAAAAGCAGERRKGDWKW